MTCPFSNFKARGSHCRPLMHDNMMLGQASPVAHLHRWQPVSNGQWLTMIETIQKNFKIDVIARMEMEMAGIYGHTDAIGNQWQHIDRELLAAGRSLLTKETKKSKKIRYYSIPCRHDLLPIESVPASDGDWKEEEEERKNWKEKQDMTTCLKSNITPWIKLRKLLWRWMCVVPGSSKMLPNTYTSKISVCVIGGRGNGVQLLLLTFTHLIVYCTCKYVWIYSSKMWWWKLPTQQKSPRLYRLCLFVIIAMQMSQGVCQLRIDKCPISRQNN